MAADEVDVRRKQFGGPLHHRSLYVSGVNDDAAGPQVLLDRVQGVTHLLERQRQDDPICLRHRADQVPFGAVHGAELLRRARDLRAAIVADHSHFFRKSVQRQTSG